MTDRTEAMDNLIAQDADLIDAQPTQSDALLEGDTQTILYLLGVRHGREDERAKIAAEASQPTQSEDNCVECNGKGYAEIIDGCERPCDVCYGECFLRQPTQSDDEAYDLGKRDGYESAVQDIDMLTGGDGEYCYSTIGGELHCPNPDSMKARIAERFNSQPTQSDALKCEYCDNTGICGWEENPQFCGECSHGDAAFKGWNARIPVYALKVVREKAIEECAKALEADAMKCDCAAVEERECGCGAWCEWKSITSARAVEIVRELKNVPPPEGDGDQ